MAKHVDETYSQTRWYQREQRAPSGKPTRSAALFSAEPLTLASPHPLYAETLPTT